jgi:putative acetyltransferase
MTRSEYPAVADPELVGRHPAAVKAGGGFVWDAVLEYRVWLHPERGAPDLHDGNDYFEAFAGYADAAEFAARTTGAEEPLALVLQEEYIDEPEPGRYEHVKERRLTEWPVEFLRRPRRTPRTIPDFLAPDAPSNRLAILRGEAQASR